MEVNCFLGGKSGGKGKKGQVDKSQITYHKCHKKGHYANECRSKGTPKGKGKSKGCDGGKGGKDDKSKIVCNRCGKTGHKKQDCRSKQHKDGHYLNEAAEPEGENSVSSMSALRSC